MRPLYRLHLTRPLTCLPLTTKRAMNSSTARKSQSHTERTATEPRSNTLHKVTLQSIKQINPEIRLLHFSPISKHNLFTFLPGQWLDVFVPGSPKAGGFTITSSPEVLRIKEGSGLTPYFELAIKRSPENPPAAWFWKEENEILGQEVGVRVGGSFVWPPQGVNSDVIKRVVFVAGGVGINPLMSIVSHLAGLKDLSFDIRFLYTVRDDGSRNGEEILFLERLVRTFDGLGQRHSLKLFLTGRNGDGVCCWSRGIGSGLLLGERFWRGSRVGYKGRRIGKEDLREAIGEGGDRKGTVVYVCGVPAMTDEFVDIVKKAEGIDEKNVLCERWW